MAIRAEVAHVNVQQVLAALGMEYEVTGSVDGHIDIATSGRSLPQLVSSLAGKAAFTFRDQARHTDLQVHVATEVGPSRRHHACALPARVVCAASRSTLRDALRHGAAGSSPPACRCNSAWEKRTPG